MCSHRITDDTHSYTQTVSEAELCELSGQTHHLPEALSSNIMGQFQRKFIQHDGKLIY